jgi:nicotinamide-nucleotide amidase
VSDAEIRAAATRVLDAGRSRGLKIATAESGTGGLVAGALTDIAGSSDVVERGFVTYSNEAKVEMLGVDEATLAAHGAVSQETAEAMAIGAIRRSIADLAVAITGIAGPGGGSAEKPVGLVHLAAASRDGRHAHREERFGDIGRAKVRRRAVLVALQMLEELAKGNARVANSEWMRSISLFAPHYSPFKQTQRPRGARTRRRSGGTRSRTSIPSGTRACGCGTRRK